MTHDDALPDRLADLVRAIEGAGSWTVMRQGPRWLVQVDAPGHRRAALVTGEDLELLRRRLPVPPREP